MAARAYQINRAGKQIKSEFIFLEIPLPAYTQSHLDVIVIAYQVTAENYPGNISAYSL